MRTTAIASLVLLLVTPAARAASSQEIMVEVVSIAASMPEKGQRPAREVELDERLEPFSKNLRSLFAYERYTFLGKRREAVGFSELASYRLPEHFHLEVVPVKFEREDRDMIEMMVTLVKELPARPLVPGRARDAREVVLRTKIRLKNGGTVLLGGPPIRTGVLILALSAKG